MTASDRTPLLVDVSEPSEIVQYLSQSAPVSVLPLNQQLMNDYFFGTEDGKNLQLGRVQAGELLGNIDSMEDELRRYYKSADKNYWILEGIITDVPLTKRDKSLNALSVRMQSHPRTLYSYRVTDAGWIYDEHVWNKSAELLYAWIFRLAEAAIPLIWTWNYVGTAKAIASIYNNCQKPSSEHDTLNRYYIPTFRTGEILPESKKKITLREQNPFIKILMALSYVYKLEIGEKKATAISKRYGSLYDLIYAPVSELAGIEGVGITTAQKLQTAIGLQEE
jgi:hypothetical protein